MILNVYASDSIVSKFMRQKLREVKGEIHKFTIIVGDTNTSFFSNWQIKQTENHWEYSWTDQHYQLDLIDIYRIVFHKTEYTFISNSHGTLTKIEHILDHEIQLKFKRIDIIKNISQTTLELN